MQEVANRQGKFVRRVATIDERRYLGAPEDSPVWVVTDISIALEKTKQTLRERLYVRQNRRGEGRESLPTASVATRVLKHNQEIDSLGGDEGCRLSFHASTANTSLSYPGMESVDDQLTQLRRQLCFSDSFVIEQQKRLLRPETAVGDQLTQFFLPDNLVVARASQDHSFAQVAAHGDAPLAELTLQHNSHVPVALHHLLFNNHLPRHSPQVDALLLQQQQLQQQKQPSLNESPSLLNYQLMCPLPRQDAEPGQDLVLSRLQLRLQQQWQLSHREDDTIRLLTDPLVSHIRNSNRERDQAGSYQHQQIRQQQQDTYQGLVEENQLTPKIRRSHQQQQNQWSARQRHQLSLLHQSQSSLQEPTTFSSAICQLPQQNYQEQTSSLTREQKMLLMLERHRISRSNRRLRLFSP